MRAADQIQYDVEAAVVTCLVLAGALALLIAALRRHRPDLRIGLPIAAAYFVRVASAGVLSLTTLAPTLRGGDENTFMFHAQGVAAGPLDSGEWGRVFTSSLHEWVFAMQLRLMDSPDFSLRLTQIAIATVGLALLATAVHDLAGARAAVVAAWVLALEPSNVFFSGLLHKEPLMLLAEGLVAYGGAALWVRGRLTSLVPMAAGCLVATATRPYAGWFLIAASAAITLHSSFRGMAQRSTRGVALLSGVILLAAVTGPIVWQGTSSRELDTLQQSQDANATDDSNLKLERIDFSTRTEVIRNLPVRIRDVFVRPYPWELANASQRLGLLGTLFLLVGMGYLVHGVRHSHGAVLRRAGPLIYLMGFLIAGYALAAGNAGTGFRYRMHIVAVGICIVVVLRASHALRVRIAQRHQVEPPPRRAVGVAR